MSKKDSKNRRRIYGFIDKMSREVGANLSRENYPEVRFVKKASSAYNPEHNIIVINYNDLKSGDAIGEEIGHYIRRQTNPSKKSSEKLTDEFFGYLGRKILENLDVKKIDMKFGDYDFGTKKQALDYIKSHKNKAREYKQFATGEKVDPDGIIIRGYAKLKQKNHENARANILEHHRGYEFASKLDLDEVDLSELFSMSDKDVRSKFFRENQKSGLESVVAMMSGIFIGFSFLLFGQSITGNVISLRSIDNNFFGLILLILGFLGVCYYKFYNKR